MLPLPFLIGLVSFLFWSELPSGSSHVTFGMAARYWTTWTVQVREYGCPAIAKVEGVNQTFGRGSAMEEFMQKMDHTSILTYVYGALLLISPPTLREYESLHVPTNYDIAMWLQ